jgi:hypothetical protein
MDAAAGFTAVLDRHGMRPQDAHRFPTGWGNVTYGVSTLRGAGHRVTLFALPHLSRFRFIARTPGVTEDLVTRVAGAVSEALT